MDRAVFDCAFDGDISAFVIAGLVTLFFSVMMWNRGMKKTMLLFIVIMLSGVLSAYSRIPRRYAVDAHAVTIMRPGADVTIPADNIIRVARIERDMLDGIRRYGVVTDMGAIKVGLFRNDALGRFQAFMTSDRNPVLLATSSRTYVLTPDDPDGFVEAVHGMGISD